MKIKDKTNLFLQIFAWICLVINGLVTFISFYIKTNDINTVKFAIISAIIIIILGFVKIDRDIAVGELSLSSVIMTWLGVLIISIPLAYYLFFINIIGFVVLIVTIMLEISTAFIIIYRHRIYNYLKTNKKSQRAKKNRSPANIFWITV